MEDDLNRKIILTLSLLAVFLLSACAPSAPAPTPTPILPPVAPEPVENQEAPVAPTVAAQAATAQPTDGPTAVAIVPTSRGNDLHATDPVAVNVASGRPQLIEFFAFW